MQLCVLPKSGCGCAPHSSEGSERRSGVGNRSGSCSVMYTENLAIYVISVCDFNQRQSWPRSRSSGAKLLNTFSEREREREGQRGTPIGPAVRPPPQGGRCRLGAFQISWPPSLGTVWCGSVLNFN